MAMTSYTVQPDWKVLVLEDAPERVAWFKDRVPQAVYVTTAEDAITALMSQEFRVVFLDHDLHWMHAADNAIVKGTGKEVATRLLTSSGFARSTILSLNLSLQTA